MHAIWGRWLVCAGLALALVGCETRVDPTKSSVELDKVAATADGTDGIQVTVTVIGTDGQAFAGAEVTFSFDDGSTSGFDPTSGTSGADGRVQVRAVSTVAMDLSVVATANGVALADRPLLQFDAGPVASLSFSDPPSDTVAGTVFSPAVKVLALDAFSNLADGVAGTVTLASSDGTSLLGTASVALVGGVATFDDLAPTGAGTGRQLVARISGAPDLLSSPYSVSAGTTRQLRFTQHPPALVAAGEVFTEVRVRTADAYGNFTSASGEVTLLPEGGGGLAGTLTVPLVSGEASFTDVSRTVVGSGLRLRAISFGLVDGLSLPFEIAPGPPTQLAFRVQPTTTGVNQAMVPPVVVAVVDDYGNTVPLTLNTVYLSLSAGPTATLGGTTSSATTDGVAVFDDLTVDTVGTGYQLTAQGLLVRSATSGGFEITSPPINSLVFGTQPSNVTAGPLGALTVELRGPSNELLTDRTDPVQVSVWGAGATLSGNTLVLAEGGVATFTELGITRAGDYRLAVVASGFAPATSQGFAVSPSSVAELSFTAHPLDARAGDTLAAAVVQAVDVFRNPTSTFAGAITVSIASGPPGGALAGTVTRDAANGAATFDDLVLTRAGTYRLQASAGALAPDTGRSFVIDPGPASALRFTTQPTGAPANRELGTSTVQVEDAFGNVVTSAVAQVTMSLSGGTSGATLGGTTTATLAGGSATFSDLTVSADGSGYRLHAVAGALEVQSVPFEVGP